MKFFSKTRNKIILIFAITIMVFTVWEVGFERIYSNFLIGTSNIVLKIAKENTYIELEKVNNAYQFKVHTMVTGRKASFPQEIGGLLQPFVIILSWQIFLFIILKTRPAFKSMVVNFVIFTLIQIFFLYILTGYYNSDFNKFVFSTMLDTFYIFALILVIKDNLLYGVFRDSIYQRFSKS